MKGQIIYLIEVAAASILVILILGFFLSAKYVKSDWTKSDLVSMGNNMFALLTNESIVDIMNNRTDFVDRLKPPNVDFSVEFSGTPSNNISVGCVSGQFCGYARILLNPTYVNKRWVNFTVIEFDIDSGEIPDYDSLILINYTGYSANKDKINRYLDSGGTVLAINYTVGADADFNSIFNITPLTFCTTSNYVNFTKYKPEENVIPKYFLGFGMDVRMIAEWDANKKWGVWNLWDGDRRVNMTQNSVEIEDGGFQTTATEGGTFVLSVGTPDGNPYRFKVKKIFWPDSVVLQSLDKTFTFKEFSEGCVIGNGIVSEPGRISVAMSANNSAIWISDFPYGDSYKALVKSAIATSKLNWFIKEPSRTREKTKVSSVVGLCCDMPETIDLTFILWYAY